MKALSIRQPWAWLIMRGIKDVENRNWKCNYRGPLLIHASKTWDPNGFDFISDRMDEYVPSKEYHSYGRIIGVVDMVDCVDVCESKWFFGPWGFVFENPRIYEKPVPHRGRLGLFDVPLWPEKLKGWAW